MFKSRLRNVITPQMTHAMFAGHLAYHWGNEHFDKPSLEFSSFVKAIGNHHLGYGFFDTIDFTTLDDDQILKIFKDDCGIDMGDSIAELVIKFHNARLVQGRIDRGGGDVIKNYLQELREEMNASLKNVEISREDFMWTDRLTNLCDKISFDFCFENPTSAKIGVYQKKDDKDQLEIEYIIEDDGLVRVNPWPFNIDKITGYIQGYRSESYPVKLVPVVKTFVVTR